MDYIGEKLRATNSSLYLCVYTRIYLYIYVFSVVSLELLGNVARRRSTLSCRLLPQPSGIAGYLEHLSLSHSLFFPYKYTHKYLFSRISEFLHCTIFPCSNLSFNQTRQQGTSNFFLQIFKLPIKMRIMMNFFKKIVDKKTRGEKKE